MSPAQIIADKRDGRELTENQIAAFIQGYSDGSIPDYQMAALAMAVFLNGMTAQETAWLTEQMLASGVTLRWPDDGVPRVDKHSTGGVGDKISIPLAPLLACCGLQVPMLSGRGLGATGGTLDKLESIPGFRTDLSLQEITRLTQQVGCVITGASRELAPADRKLYALRDVTATVPSIPLITASIMSKKLAESLNALVLDVKYGNGAFMKTRERAAELAESLTATGRRMGVRTTAVLSDMNQPLGRMCGNALEILESVDVLRGGGPADVRQLTLQLGTQLLLLTETESDAAAAEQRLAALLDRGHAYEKYAQMVAAQGGDADAIPGTAPAGDVEAVAEGVVSAIDTEAIGLAIIAMGGGRRVMTDRIDHSVGVEMCVRLGDHVRPGDVIARVFCRDFPSAAAALKQAIRITT
ncbi:MAG: thymidine phosphorylase [Planctomycetaceae bacterium]|nr:thymidine phosphorylase [Planctomycetaceae bacterium]